MNPSDYRVRRATLEDLGTLKALWESMRFPVAELEKRLTEFQIAEGPDGKVMGGFGFQILGRQGLIHSEAYTDFSIADIVRPLLWNRLQSLILNHGVARLWTREQSPFWTHSGLKPASDDALANLPEPWGRTASGWSTLQLKDEQAIASLEKEFAMFMQSEKQRTTRALDQAKTLKVIVTVIAFILVIGIIGAAVYVFLARRNLGSPGP